MTKGLKEIYRSFEGKLDMENQSGYVIYETERYYHIEFLDIDREKQREVRIWKEHLKPEDFGDLEKITEIWMDIENGRADYGQCLYRGKWWTYDNICMIQKANQDMNWKRYAR